MFVLLEKPSIYCCQILLYGCYIIDVWNNLLETWFKKVVVIKTFHFRHLELFTPFQFSYAFSSFHNKRV